MAQPIILYDIPSTAPGSAWSPNVWKTRFALNYKGIPYRTEWIEYPDIEATCKSIGASPTEERDGRPLYTLPVIYDPSTRSAIAESAVIAEYLDATYPDTPKLMPLGKESFKQEFLIQYRTILPKLWQFIFPATERLLNPPSQSYFDAVKYGSTIPHESPTGESRQIEWKKIQADFDLFAKWLDEHGDKEGPHILGAEVSFLDFVLGGYLFWMRITLGEESKEWKDISTWNGGRFGALLEGIKKYEVVC
ncbi:hypothetical protein H0H93_013320 [Arthromyces matolae]|nr:hypothetical protein H0H93_013320 [Arthromyces matolae]